MPSVQSAVTLLWRVASLTWSARAAAAQLAHRHGPALGGWRHLSSVVLISGVLWALPVLAGSAPVRVGLDAEFGNKSSTVDDALRAGLEIAIEEINAGGGVLGGRRVELVTRDNRGVPARGIDNLRELAAMPDMVAVFGSKFSPVLLAQLPLAHELKIPLLSLWSAADGITVHDYRPSYSFRLSLRDGWVMPYLLQQVQARGYSKVGMLVPNGAWGRSNLNSAESYSAKNPQPRIVRSLVYEWADESLTNEYEDLLAAGAEAIILVGN